MLSLNYHKRYLWIFFISFLILLCTALTFDCVIAATTTQTATAKGYQFVLRAPRFINVFLVFVCSSLSIVIQNYISRAIFRIDLLSRDSKTWKHKLIRVRKRPRIKKVTKSYWLASSVFGCMFANLVFMLPVISVFVLFWLDYLDTLKDKNLIVEFFIPAISLKYFCWYLDAIFSWLFVFHKNKRMNIMMPVSRDNI